MIDTADFSKGKKLGIENKIFEIVDFQHNKTAMRKAVVWTKLKNLSDGSVIERTFKAGEKFPEPDYEEREVQFLYKSGDTFTFMSNDTFEQIELRKEQTGDTWKFLTENQTVKIVFFEEKPIGVDMAASVILKVIETDPSFKGDTVSGSGKPAKLETGITVSVPFFINEGELVKIDTRTEKYIERAK
ncbi:MAG: elongation factor P [bacterium]|nr:elongation factor P [bacterium]